MKQYEQVIEVMESNSGYATLGFLYQNLEVSNWKTKTPYASIRRIVQTSGHFFKIRPGLWALNDCKESVLRKLNLITEDVEQEVLFNHTYYQGLLVEIGNLRNYLTYIPNQDKNKLFLNMPLRDVSNLDGIYNFTYSSIVRRASTVDVIWFNDRKLPHSFFEIEHSTDFQNSLIKYTDLQDFNSKFYLVGPLEKNRRFKKIIDFNIFSNIKSRVKFIDYDFVSDLHSNTIKTSELSKQLVI